ncbi:Uma2 family endonuclease [Fimbriiglobus ruber]|uniref:Putative restriction endonuclease domain-containing protein n=1 Tax=Fimbriiglobus ruber TaxID=1908690 RepID=A0A225E1G4_9BACT|nr:Uma2 family endonuclease [Fimbriiglobus ruber]OWK43856.1 hypothetical protein FRUB_03455 [Fimbriiglobus ruber]
MIRKAEFDPFARNEYPTSDGRPMAETDTHRLLMTSLIETLSIYYSADPNVYVSGNLLLFYEPDDKRRHLSPDCFVVKGVPAGTRPNYLMWEEGKGPDVVFELTSKTTRSEDTDKKFEMYRDVFGVSEYFLFDPLEEYLTPSMQGYRRVGTEFRPIEMAGERLPSEVLGLHLERADEQLRLWNPATRTWLPTQAELTASEAAARRRAEVRERAEAAARAEAEARARVEVAARQRVEAELDQLRRELDALRRGRDQGS